MASCTRFTGIRELLTLVPTGASPDEQLGRLENAAIDCDEKGRVVWHGLAWPSRLNRYQQGRAPLCAHQ